MDRKYLIFRDEFKKLFAEELHDYSKSQDLYRSLCNNIWIKEGQDFSYSWRAAGEMVADIRNSLDLPRADKNQCQNCKQHLQDHVQEQREIIIPLAKEERPVQVTEHFCSAEKTRRFVQGYTGSEDYMDFYCSGYEGRVALWIRERAEGAGYKIKSG